MEEEYSEEEEKNIAETTREATIKDVLIILSLCASLEQARKKIEEMKRDD